MTAPGINHSERAHALLSASGSHRWLNCTPSARLEDKFTETAGRSSSVYADEGTLAHEFGNLRLLLAIEKVSSKVYEKERKDLQKNMLYYEGMEQEVEVYVNYVMEAYGAAQAITKDAVLMIEEKLDYSHLVEKGEGTGDACIIADGTLEIVDLKFGKGIKVSAVENSQLMLYAIGALRKFDMMYDIRTVKLTIVQPRLESISSWPISVPELMNWGEKVVRPKAAEAYEGKGLQKAGEWCRFCKVKGMCATLAAYNIKLAKYDFKSPHFLTDQQLIDVYKQIPMLVDWANSVEKHLLDTAVEGKHYPGYKVVEGRANRAWSDKEGIEKYLKDEGFERNKYITESLAGIPAVEKLVGAKKFAQDCKQYVVIPKGKPTFVPESDKRPAMGIEQAKLDFSQEV